MARQWTLEHTEMHWPGKVEDGGYWFAWNRKTGVMISGHINWFADDGWRGRQGLPAYISKAAKGETCRWWDRLYRTGEAPSYFPGGSVSNLQGKGGE